MSFKDKLDLVEKVMGRVYHARWLLPKRFRGEWWAAKDERLSLILKLVSSNVDLASLLDLNDQSFAHDILEIIEQFSVIHEGWYKEPKLNARLVMKGFE